MWRNSILSQKPFKIWCYEEQFLSFFFFLLVVGAGGEKMTMFFCLSRYKSYYLFTISGEMDIYTFWEGICAWVGATNSTGCRRPKELSGSQCSNCRWWKEGRKARNVKYKKKMRQEKNEQKKTIWMWIAD